MYCRFGGAYSQRVQDIDMKISSPVMVIVGVLMLYHFIAHRQTTNKWVFLVWVAFFCIVTVLAALKTVRLL